MDQQEPFHQQLKQLRIAQGFELADISATTRIDPRFLAALEEGDFDVLPMTYIRLFLRSYCEFIGFDFQEAVQKLEEVTGEARREDLPSYAESIPMQNPDISVKSGAGMGDETRTPVRLRQDLFAGSVIIIFLVMLTIFARRAYEPPAESLMPTGLGSTPAAVAPMPLTPPPNTGGNGSQPVVPLESEFEFPDELFSQDRIIANVQERVRLTPPVRLTLMVRDNLVIQPISGGVAEVPFNMTVAKARRWTINEELILRTTGIHLLRGDLNGTPINFGQAQGLGTLRITPTGIYEVSAYLSR